MRGDLLRPSRLMIISFFVALSLLIALRAGTTSAQPGCYGCVYYQGGASGSTSVSITASAGCGNANNCNSQQDVVALEYCGAGSCADPGFSCASTGGTSPPITCTYSLPACNGGGYFPPEDGSGTGTVDPGAITNAPCIMTSDKSYPCGANVYCDAPNYPTTPLAVMAFSSGDTGTYTFCEFAYSNVAGSIADSACAAFVVSGGSVTSVASSTAALGALCTVYSVVTATIDILGLLLMILGGAVYAGASFVPAQMRGTLQGYGMGMIMGGVAGVIISLVAPYILELIIGQSAGAILAVCP